MPIIVVSSRSDDSDKIEALDSAYASGKAQAAGRLSHPHIVAIYDYGEEADGTAFIAMEFIKGRELKEYFEAHERFATADAVRILTQILSALGYSHKLGVIHRDIKPANIFMVDRVRPMVLDFGIAHSGMHIGQSVNVQCSPDRKSVV